MLEENTPNADPQGDPVVGYDFGRALFNLKNGKKVCRRGWNGKGMWIIMAPGSTVDVAPGSPYEKAGLGVVEINPHIDMKTATGEMQPGWLASQTDMLAEDWESVE